MIQVPVDRLRPIVEAWLAEHEFGGFEALAAGSGLSESYWRKRVGPTGSWWDEETLSENDVDAFLSAADLADRWYLDFADLLPTSAGLRCEDCGKQPLDVDDYRPLDLMRADPSAGLWLWDATKQRPTHRPRQARVGGRRFRHVDLCRRCAADVLRKRGGGSIMQDGKKRYLSTRERVAPRRGGRPRLLTDAQLRSLHGLYAQEKLSLNDLVDRLLAGGKVAGTRQGLYQSMLYGWRRLDLPLRSKSEAQHLAHARRGRIRRLPQRCPATNRKGTRCELFVKIGGAYCVSHQHLEAEAMAA